MFFSTIEHFTFLWDSIEKQIGCSTAVSLISLPLLDVVCEQMIDDSNHDDSKFRYLKVITKI